MNTLWSRQPAPGPATGIALAGAGLAVGVVVGVGLGAQLRPIAATTAGTPISTTTVVVVPSWPISRAPNLPPPLAPPSTGTGPPAPVASGLAGGGIPEIAMRAYRRAADAMTGARPSCGLHWSLLAAIGRVETNHGRFGGSRLRADGSTTTPIRGPQLNGSPFARITDTDGGVLDGDTAFDRAVGPMQFIPGTWRMVARDGNGDGRSDPHNLYDAALGAAVLLCSGEASLADEGGVRAAALRYNHSAAYADLVVSLARSYRAGVVTVPREVLAGALDQHPLPVNPSVENPAEPSTDTSEPPAVTTPQTTVAPTEPETSTQDTSAGTSPEPSPTTTTPANEPSGLQS